MTEQYVFQALLFMSPLIPLAVWRTGSDWTHPVAFAALYVIFVCLAPFYFVVATGRPLGVFTPELADRPTFLTLYLFSLCFALGSLIGKGRPCPADKDNQSGPQGGAGDEKEFVHDWRLLRRLARITLLCAAAIRVAETVGPRGDYGANQLDFNAMTAVGTAVDLVVLPAVVCLVLANKNINVKGPVLLKPEVLALIVYAAASLYVGSRSPLMAPIVFIAFAIHRWHRPIRVWIALPAALALVLLFAYIGNERSGNETSFDRLALTESTLTTLASVDFVTAKTVTAIDSAAGPQTVHGDTYLATLASLLPGPLVRALNEGRPLDTGAFYFRDLIGFHDSNHGYSYATPAEAYLNFGLTGTAALALLLGLAMRFTWAHTEAIPRTLRSVVYPTLLAVLPYGLRSDALTHAKSAIYTIAIVALLLFIVKRRWKSDPFAAQRYEKHEGHSVDPTQHHTVSTK